MNIPATMQAVGLDETTGQLIIKQMEVPRPGKGEVLVKISAAPVNPSDLARIRNLTSPAERRSFIAGIEGSGTVVAHGGGLIPRLLTGRRVACSSSNHKSGTWAEFMVTKAMGCVPLPIGISSEQGAMMLVNPLTAIAFFNIALKNKHKAVINTAAASALGKMISLLGNKHGIPVIHIVRNEKQQASLLKGGAIYVLNSAVPDFAENLYKISKKLEATLIFDAVGGSLTHQLLVASPFGSTLMVYGNLSGEQPLIDHMSLVADNKKVYGFYLVNWLKEQAMLTMLTSILKARQMLKSDITIPVQGKFPLTQVQQAVDSYMGNMSAGKVLLIP